MESKGGMGLHPQLSKLGIRKMLRTRVKLFFPAKGNPLMDSNLSFIGKQNDPVF